MDATLIERAQRGDRHAYGELVTRYSEIAFRTACVLGTSPADAEDVVQDAFVKAYRALARFQAGRSFRPWLLEIVGNEARNRRRWLRRRAALELRLREDRREDPSPEQLVVAAARRRALLQAIRELPPADQQVITLRHLLQLSVAETASALGLPEGTVKSRLARALERLRARPELADE